MRRTAAFLAAGILVAAGGLAHAATERWLHVRVQEHSGKGENVRINLPLTMLESVAPLLDEVDVDGGHLRIDDKDLDAVERRKILEAVRSSPDGEYVAIDSEDSRVRVA